MMLLKSVRNCDRTPLLLTQQQPTNTTAEDRGGRRKNPKLAIFGGRKRGKKGGREGGREWTWVAFQQAEMRWRWRRGGKEAERRGASLLTRTMAIWLAAE